MVSSRGGDPDNAHDSDRSAKDVFSELPRISGKEFSFAKLIRDTRDLEIVPYDKSVKAHRALKKVILAAAEECRKELGQTDSPLRELKRINEASRYFEDLLREKIDRQPDFSCRVPRTEEGKKQRSGYPDLRLEHLPSHTVAYLDPKVFASKSLDSSFRTFYYEPTGKSGKITENALHFLIGFPHDSKTRAWTFGKPHLVDLSDLVVTLKAEFHASNRDLYGEKLEL